MKLSSIIQALAEAGIENPRYEAALLVSHFAGISYAAVLAEREADYAVDGLDTAVERRAARYPLQYILGRWEFCGLEFEVDESCLIPRSDTEVVAEAAVRELSRAGSGASILDLCTGSGCIAAAVLSMGDATTRAVAVELMPKTASLARRNIDRLGLSERCTVIEGDVTSEETLARLKELAPFDVIVSNPPYVTAEEMQSLEPELDFEPRCALTDEGDGMSIINEILRLYPPLLKKGGALIIEHGSEQLPHLASLPPPQPIYDMSGKRRAEIWHLVK